MLRRSIRAMALSAIMIGNACGGGLSRDLPGLGAAVLAISPSSLDFGNVVLDKTKTMTGTLTADNSDVVVSSAEWNGGGYALTSVTFPITIPAGQSISFKVTF